MQGFLVYFRLIILFHLLKICYPNNSNTSKPLASNEYAKIVFSSVYICFGTNIGSHVEQRILQHLTAIRNLSVYRIQTLNQLSSADNSLNENILALSLGNCTITKQYIPQSELDSLEYESFIIRFQSAFTYNENLYTLVTDGLPLNPNIHHNVSFDKRQLHYGAIVGSYATLELLGFGFLHPLEPYIPSEIRIEINDQFITTDKHIKYEIYEAPYWPERCFHIHTQHPLELTEVLQGHDIPQFGPHGPACNVFKKRSSYVDYNVQSVNGSEVFRITRKNEQVIIEDELNRKLKIKQRTPYCERWEDMVTDVDYFFEWAVANRLNQVEWLLLGNFKWGDELETRMKRLKILTNIGHKYSLLIGADCPIGNIQQHAWHMVNMRLSFKQQALQIRQRIDWVFSSGFDFITTESGLSEFTHPECDLMLDLLNEFASYANTTWGRSTGIKVHCSTGQYCDDFLDPRTGEPINFNFLPTLAHSGLAVFPHTVQVYALDDPTAGAYGNDNFSYIEDYMVFEAQLHNRSVLFYGETAYWVNVDIDVPLFLPIYGQRRLHDLRRIALREVREGFRIQGQMNFDSGWEWGYWLNNVITARASWNPKLPSAAELERIDNTTDPTDKLKNIEDYLKNNQSYEARHDEWSAFSQALEPVIRIFPPPFGRRLRDLLVNLSQSQAELLILGEIDGNPSPNLKKLSGMAYMSGSDTWVDVPRRMGIPFTQPDKIRLKESDDPLWPDVMKLLTAMDETFGRMAAEMKELWNDAVKVFCSLEDLTHPHQIDYCHSIESPQPMKRSEDLLNEAALKLLSEFHDCFQVLALRAKHVHLIYQSRHDFINHDGVDEDVNEVNPTLDKSILLKQSRGVIQMALDIVRGREQLYRVDWQRIGAWRENSTVYRYGYLWAVHSLYYWWREQGIAESGTIQSEHSPCYLNRMDVTEVSIGWGKQTIEIFKTFIQRYTPFLSGYPLEVMNCLSPPSKEYEFPKDLYLFE